MVRYTVYGIRYRVIVHGTFCAVLCCAVLRCVSLRCALCHVICYATVICYSNFLIERFLIRALASASLHRASFGSNSMIHNAASLQLVSGEYV